MIREIIVDIREGDSGERLLDAITREMNYVALESNGIDPGFYKDDMDFEHVFGADYPRFPGHVVINVFDENEKLMEVIET